RESSRDQGIALARILMSYVARRDALPTGVAQQAVDLLESALKNDPEDIEAREAKAQVMAFIVQAPDALAVCEDILAKNPHREVALMCAAAAAETQQQPALALSYWRRAVMDNPWNTYFRHKL